MTTTTTQTGSAPGTVALPEATPSRRLLVALSGGYLAFFGVLSGLSGDRSPEDDPGKLIAGYDVGDTAIQLMTYGAMVAAALLVFYGAGLRSVLRSRGAHWTSDAAFIGFVVMGLTLASFAVMSLALHAAIASGDAQVVRAINILDTTNFPPAMIGLMCSMIGVGVCGLKQAALPKWLAWGSIVIGVVTPLGPGGFVPFTLFPIWLVVVAATVRRVDA